jgi:small conductance mechanosensitive channel
LGTVRFQDSETPISTSTSLVDTAGLGCETDPSFVCRQVLELTDSETTASVVNFVVTTPLRMLVIVVLAVVANRLIRRAIKRFAERLATGRQSPALRAFRERTPNLLQATSELNLRSAARAQTLAAVLRSITTGLIYSIAGLLILAELGINLGPLIAGAGIAGVALGFGAQSLVKDFLSGIFLIIEDQYGVGDIVDVGEATGVVEAVTLRSTRLRDVEGTVWHVPNGEIARVGNKSQQWARALIDVSVAYETDLRQAQDIISRVAVQLATEEYWRDVILDTPSVWGVEALAADGIDIRLVVKTKPSEQFTVMRELRIRLKEAFDEAGIEIPYPQRTLWVRNPEGAVVPGVTDGAATRPGTSDRDGEQSPPAGPAPTTAPRRRAAPGRADRSP